MGCPRGVSRAGVAGSPCRHIAMSACPHVVVRRGDGATGRGQRGDRQGATGRRGDRQGATGRRGDRELGSQGAREPGRRGDREPGSWGAREPGSQGDGATGQRGNGATGRRGGTGRRARTRGRVAKDFLMGITPSQCRFGLVCCAARGPYGFTHRAGQARVLLITSSRGRSPGSHTRFVSPVDRSEARCVNAA